MDNVYIDGIVYKLVVRCFMNDRQWRNEEIKAVWSEKKKAFDPYVNTDDVVSYSFSMNN